MCCSDAERVHQGLLARAKRPSTSAECPHSILNDHSRLQRMHPSPPNDPTGRAEFLLRQTGRPYSVPNGSLSAQNAFIPYQMTSPFLGNAPVHAEWPHGPQSVPPQSHSSSLLRAERLSIGIERLHSLSNDHSIHRDCTRPHRTTLGAAQSTCLVAQISLYAAPCHATSPYDCTLVHAEQPHGRRTMVPHHAKQP